MPIALQENWQNNTASHFFNIMSYFPEATSPESCGIPTDELLKFCRMLNSLDSLHTLQIIRHGKLVCRAEWAPYQISTRQILHSLSKSFTSIAVGFAVQEGRLAIRDKIVTYFPQYACDSLPSKMGEVTLEHLLTMTSGHKQCPMAIVEEKKETDWVKCFLTTPLEYEPGTHFVYNSAGTHVLAAIIKAVTGQNVRDYLLPRLFAPLGIIPGLWECSENGINAGGWGLHLCADDLARFGYCLLHNGQWEGRQIIPGDYLAQACIKHSDNSMNEHPDWKQGYGYQFWRSRHGYRGDEAFGQYVVVLPEDDTVVVTTSALANMGQILDELWKLREHFTDSPLPANPSAVEDLNKFLSTLVIVPFRGRRQNAGIALRTARFLGDNGNHCSVEVDGRQCALTFYFDGRVEQLTASFIEATGACSALLLGDTRPHIYRSIATWQNSDTLLIKALAVDTGWIDEYHIDWRTGGTLIRTTKCALGLGYCHKALQFHRE